jgi:anti-anti-sigma factor
VAPLEFDLAPDPAELGGARGRVGRWLDDLGADADTIYEVQLAVSEALSNAIEHAHRDASPGDRVELEVNLLPTGRLHCCVADHGRWSEPSLAGHARGRGLALIRMVTEELQLDRRPDGTTVTFERPLTRPATVTPATGTAVGAQPDVPFETVSHVTGDGPVLAVTGPVELSTVEAFTAALLSAARGGEVPLVVDLTGVTHLASTGVRALVELVRDGGRVRLSAPSGSPARLVIDLVGLSHLLVDAPADASTDAG